MHNWQSLLAIARYFFELTDCVFMSLIIVRHGETVDNASRTFQQPSSLLSKKGEQQATLLAQRLRGSGASKIVSSDYKRTQQTAAPIAEALGLEVSLTSLLRERNFGDLRGRRYAGLSFDPFALDYQPINGENWDTFHQRASLAWQSLLELADGCDGGVIAVTHGFMCRALVANHAYLPEAVDLPNHWGNTSVTEVDRRDHQVRLLNCTAHLEGDFSDGRRGGQV